VFQTPRDKLKRLENSTAGNGRPPVVKLVRELISLFSMITKENRSKATRANSVVAGSRSLNGNGAANAPNGKAGGCYTPGHPKLPRVNSEYPEHEQAQAQSRRRRRKMERHGYYGESIYNIWRQMIQRCENPNSKDYHYYGGRGIRVCERWQSFLGFLCDMGMRPYGLTLDRLDPNGNYERSNCRWATRQEQRDNWRKTDEH
jgi:hypothetical protein